MGKEYEGNKRKKGSTILFVSVVVVATATAGVIAHVNRPIHEQGITITVCELDTKLIVSINETDFNPNVYSKTLEDCQ